MIYPYNTFQGNGWVSQPYGGLQNYAQPQATHGAMNWVESDEEAYAYPVAPNTAVPLWHRHRKVIFLKQADAAGRISMSILDYTERSGQAEQPQSAPATKEDLTAITTAITEEIRKLAETLNGGTKND